jgi:hypothetical protein
MLLKEIKIKPVIKETNGIPLINNREKRTTPTRIIERQAKLQDLGETLILPKHSSKKKSSKIRVFF